MKNYLLPAYFHLIVILFLIQSPMFVHAQDAFITVNETQFIKDQEPYYFLGTNFWYGMHLAAAAPIGNRDRLIRELDLLDSLGINNLRIMAASEGPDTEPWRVLPSLQPGPGEYNELLLEGLDYLLVEMGKRGMKAVVCLNNFWPWSGGMAQYLAWSEENNIPYPPPAEGGSWAKYQLYTGRFYDSEVAMTAFDAHVQKIVTRVNSISQLSYAEDPTIMSWQLANEPRGFLHRKAFLKWIDRSARLIRSLDPNHLISLGSEGYTNTKLSGTHFIKAHKHDLIDYVTFHLWIQNWGWYDPEKHPETIDGAYDKARTYLQRHVKKGKKLKKPMVLEEFGVARDLGDHNPTAPTSVRDKYYEFIFELLYQYSREGKSVSGANFWAWGGFGRPRSPKTIWKKGDDFIGDPPHEYQGWYSVYDQDKSTLAVIQEYTEKFNSL